MGYAAKWLGVVVAAAASAPFGNLPVILGESWALWPPAVAQSESADDRLAEADRLLEEGIRLYEASQFQEALQSYQQALGIYREQIVQSAFAQRSRLGEGRAIHNSGLIYTAQGDHQQALEFYSKGLAIFRELEDVAREAIALGNLGSAYRSLGLAQQAIDAYEQQLNVLQEPENDQQIISTLGHLGDLHNTLGQYQQAIDVYERQLSIARANNNRSQEGRTLRSLGNVYLRLGAYQQSLVYFDQYLNLARSLGDLSAQGIALLSLAGTHISLQNYREVVPLATEGVEILTTLIELAENPQNQNSIGLSEQDIQQFEEARKIFEDYISLIEEIFAQTREWSDLEDWNNIAPQYESIVEEQYQRQLDLFLQRLATIRQSGNQSEEDNLLRTLGSLYRRLDQPERALYFNEQRLALAREKNDRAREGDTLSDIGILFDEQGNPDLAIIFLKASVEVRESIRGNIRGLDTELQQSFTNTVAGSYRRLANLLLSQGRIPEAQQVLDLLQLEELREFTNTRATWTGTALAFTDPEQTVIDAHGSLIALGSRILDCEATSGADCDTLYDQQEALKAQYDRQVAEFNRIVRANRADDDVFQNPETISGEAEELLAAYAEAGETAVLIYPFVLEDKLWLVWATAGNVIGSVEVPVPQAELSATVQRFGELLNRGALDDLQATSQQLYGWIIEPLAAELEKNGVDHLIFVNDRVTRYIPMAALFDGENFLIERYRVSTVLSPAVTETGGRLGPVDESQVLGLGLTQAVAGLNPLPAVKEELAAIVRDDSVGAGIFPGRVFLDEAFTFDALRDNVASHRVLHVATHAAFVPGRAAESYIVLGNGDRLFIPDIETIERRLRNLHLVVLSACQTALGGPAGDGTEIAGLSSYFLRPGRAETVVASLWKVDDDSTSVLMQRFYEFLATGELTKAEALRQAQLSLLYNEDTATRLAASRATGVVETLDGIPLSAIDNRHPYHWAPFILIGNGL